MKEEERREGMDGGGRVRCEVRGEYVPPRRGAACTHLG